MRKKKMPRLPNGYGSIRKLSGSRRNKYGVYPPQLEEDINGRRLPVRALCYVSTWTAAFAVLTAYHAGTYVPGMELEMDYQDPSGAEIDAISGILADYSRLRRSVLSGARGASAPTFRDVYERYFDDKYHTGSTFSESSMNSTQAAFKNCQALHDRAFEDITVDDLQKVIDDCPLKFSSLELIRGLLRQMYAFAMSRDIVGKDCSQYIKIRRPDDDDHGVPFSDDDLRILWQHQEDPIVEFILIMCYAGYRINAYKDIEVNVLGRYFLGGNKTAAGKNLQIPIHSAILPIVARRISRDGVLLPISTTLFRQRMYATLSALGISKHTPHDCKHTFSALCEKYGVNENDRKRMLGHRIGNITNDVYGHRDLEDLRREIEKIQAPVESVSKAGHS